MEEIDRTAEFEKYGPEGYWPEGTPCPRRPITGRVGVGIVKDKIIAEKFDKVPQPALETIMANPAFKQCRTVHNIDGTSEIVDESPEDIIDALELLKQEAE